MQQRANFLMAQPHRRHAVVCLLHQLRGLYARVKVYCFALVINIAAAAVYHLYYVVVAQLLISLFHRAARYAQRFGQVPLRGQLVPGL